MLVDAGSAVTVDWLDETHAFRGGAIFPGLRLMAEALHDYTALLPRVTIAVPVPELPGPSTVPAMQAGIFWAVVGGIDRAVRRLGRLAAAAPEAVPDRRRCRPAARRPASARRSADVRGADLWPEQTLEGILHSAEALP